ncbi:hypothetical protein ACQP04_02220 [Pseudonocardia halophobica]|uniref:hypothetical protein n=1 Tax=Pseudonocardia halophobica TaxID=29401 RepID=UPI003D8D5749
MPDRVEHGELDDLAVDVVVVGVAGDLAVRLQERRHDHPFGGEGAWRDQLLEPV